MSVLFENLLPIPLAFAAAKTIQLVIRQLRSPAQKLGGYGAQGGVFSYVFIGLSSILLTGGAWLCFSAYSEIVVNIGLSLFEIVLPLTFAAITFKMTKVLTGRWITGFSRVCIITDIVIAAVFAPFCFLNWFVRAGYLDGAYVVFTNSDLSLFPVYYAVNILAAVITVVSIIYGAACEPSRRNIVCAAVCLLPAVLYGFIAVMRFANPELRMLLAYLSPLYIFVAVWYEERYLGGLLSGSSEAKVIYANQSRPHLLLKSDGTVYYEGEGIADFFGVPTVVGLNIRDLITLTDSNSDMFNFSGSVSRSEFVKRRNQSVYCRKDSDFTLYVAVKPAEQLQAAILAAENVSGGSHVTDTADKAGLSADVAVADDNTADTPVRVATAEVSAKYDFLGSFICVVVFLYDITEYENLRRIAEESKEELEANNRHRSMFLTSASFELRSPLNTIHGLTELMLMLPNLPTVAQDYLFRLSAANAFLIATTDDIIEYSAIESGMLTLSDNEYSFSTLMYNVFSAVREKIADKAVLLIADIDPGIPAVLKGDDTRVKHALLNLLINACGNTVQGFIRVQADIIMKKNCTAELIFTISDSGISAGSDVKQNGDVFSAVSAVSVTSENSGAEHSGVTKFSLGLAQKLCNLMGGDVTADSAQGLGSVFTMRILQKYDKGANMLATVHNPHGKKVLLCESRNLYLDSLELTLTRLGVEFDVAKSDEKIMHICRKVKTSGVWAYTHVFIASFFYVNIKSNAAFAEIPNLSMYILTECSDNIHYSNARTIPMPANVINIAAALNEEHANTAALFAQSAARFTAPQARALVIDDVETNLLVMRGMLAQYELTVDICTGGRRALTMLELYDYDIIFMDHIMPDMDGIETTQCIRKFSTSRHDIGFYKKLPIIAITANVGAGIRDKLIEAGMNDYLKKPIMTGELNDVLINWLPADKKHMPDSVKSAAFEIAVNSFYIDGLNTTSGMSHTGGTIETYRKILRVFCDESTEKAEQLVYAYENGDYDTLSNIYRSLVNVSKQIGAFGISTKAVELDGICVERELTSLRIKYNLFLKDLLTLVKNIRASLEYSDNPPSGAESDTAAGGELTEGERSRRRVRLLEMKDCLSQFSDALNRLEISECDVIADRLSRFTDLPEYIGSVAILSKHMLVSNFDDAEAVVLKMTDSIDAAIG